jgi:tetratricopeptide (TPR) repeat protein
MTILRSRLLAILPIMSLAFLAGNPACADQTDARLPTMFEGLRAASSEADAAKIERSIWRIWAETGDPKLDLMLAGAADSMSKGDLRTALAGFNLLIAAKPDFAEGWNKRATLYYLAGDFPASISDIDRTLELEPRHFGALAGLGLINLALDRPEAALDAFERVLRIYPANRSAKQNLDYVRRRIDENSL